MVFESILSSKEVRAKPWKMTILGVIYASLGLVVSMWLFPSDPSLSMVFLTTMAGVPLLVNVLKREESEDFTKKQYPLIGNHKDVLGVIFFMSMGLLITFTTWYVIMPDSLNAKIFSEQINTIRSINSSAIQGNAVQTDLLKIILANNFKVLLFCLIFSLLYGAGAIFIITWNSSVLGVAIGNAIKTNISNWSSYFQAVPLGFGRYLVHGLPELIAYFLAGIAGGIISAAVIRHDPKSNKFKEVLLDSIDLIVLASIVLIIGGLLEVYISLGV
ncbi:MAG: stage II sporulation protein M [Candidatus Nanoarchaeia archaeon]|jgi:uncharacterized membrane protein SpoIIM required for sporulation